MKYQIERALKILFFLSEQITSCQQCLLISINDPSVCNRVYSGLFYSDALYPYDRWSLSCRSSKYSLQIKRRWITLKTDSNLEQYRARSGILLSQRHSPIRRFHEILLSRKLFDTFYNKDRKLSIMTCTLIKQGLLFHGFGGFGRTRQFWKESSQNRQSCW